MHREIDLLNDEMVAAGVRIFVGGLKPPTEARPVHNRADAEIRIIEGPYLQTSEHVGGFWVVEAANRDEALAWGRKVAVACRAAVEVRPFW